VKTENQKPIMRCALCGGSVVLIARPGRTSAHRNLSALEVPATLELPTCADCGEEYLDSGASAALNEALENAYQEVLRKLISKTISDLGPKVPKYRLERLLGLSRGYLSKLPEKNTSAALVCLLTLIARDPEHAISRLEEMWKPFGLLPVPKPTI
jgi:hypothetical protein